MLRAHFVIYKVLGLLLLVFLMFGCNRAIHNYKAYYGEVQKREALALIKVPAEEEGFWSVRMSIRSVDKATHSLFSGTTLSVLVEPGRRYIHVFWAHFVHYASQRLWLDAEMGKTYIAKWSSKGSSITIWIEDEKTGERVGGIPGGEPENQKEN